MPSVGDEVYILWEMRLEASPGTVLEVPVRLTMNGVVLPTTSPTYWIDPTLTFTAQSRDPYLVVPGIQTAKVELDPQNLISETTEADNVRWYAWESYAQPSMTSTRTPTRTTIGPPAPTPTVTPSPTATATPTEPPPDPCGIYGGGAALLHGRENVRLAGN